MLIRGIAGAGKTTTLKAVDQSMAHTGKTVLYLAPTTSAVEVLRQEGFGTVTTVADYLTRMESGELPHEMKSSLTVVDEAGLLSVKQGEALLRFSNKNQSRLLLVGDARQHSSVESGDFMRILEDHSQINRFELLTIRRQRPREYNSAVM